MPIGRRIALRVVGVVYALVLVFLLYALWEFFAALRGNGSIAWRPFFNALESALGMVGLGLGEIDISEGMRAFRMPLANELFELRTPVTVILGVVFLTAANWLWRVTLGRLGA